MPENVTSLNGLKVTTEYCSHKIGAHNKEYVKYPYNLRTDALQNIKLSPLRQPKAALCNCTACCSEACR